MRVVGITGLFAVGVTFFALVGSNGAQAAEVRLLTLEVKNPLKAGVPYRVTLPYSKKGTVKIIKGCFLWSGEGPYCFPVSTRSKIIKVKLRTGNPNTYKLTGYVLYRSGEKTYKSNRVSQVINVRP